MRSGRGPAREGNERPGWPAVGGRGQSRAARRRRGGSFRRALRAEALRRAELPRPAAPVTGRMRSPPYLPGAAPVARRPGSSASCQMRRSREGHGQRAERRALSGSAPPASTVLRIPLRGTRLRRAVDPGASAAPAGLTARARPEARPEAHAANLSNQPLPLRKVAILGTIRGKPTRVSCATSRSQLRSRTSTLVGGSSK